ncbi:hypothetical protein FOL47_005849 [Perkinsus chesapeaki]|uniref:Uncharacterized protein n=1 Tax=Perkinsus chesapeaki TaxID=330153 RepID=A0A7J6LVI4_PERCH|nr:hypothetical protein FOL47_005849 [Perkinsus chesapeaki]
MIFSPFIPLLPLIIVLVYADTPPQPKTTGTYRSREPAVYGTCITFRGSTMDITGPERSKLPVAAKGSWLYTVSADPSGSYAISPTGENGATWPDNIRLKLAPDAKTITLVLPGESYTCKWLNSQPSVPVQMNIQPVEDDLHGNRYVGDTPTIKWGNEEEMERGRRDFAKLRSKVDLRDDKLI